jgi:hypothetical protein
MHWIESRIKLVEERVEYLYRQLQQVLQQVRAALNQLNQVGGGGSGGSSSSGIAYTCTPNNTIAGGGNLATQTINLFQAGTGTALTGTYTLYNPYGASVASGKVCTVMPDGIGNFVVIAQSCT